VKGNFEMFPLLLGLEDEQEYQQDMNLIGNRHEELLNKIKHYFPSFSTKVYDWVRSPCSESSAQPENFLCCCLRFTDLSLDKF
jgi:hypothetical protein